MEDIINAYMNELIEKGAYTVEGIDESGEFLLKPVPEVLKELDPQLYEIYEIEANLEVEERLHSLEEKGLILRVDDENFTLTDAAIAILGE